jgi:hypothetical protein
MIYINDVSLIAFTDIVNAIEQKQMPPFAIAFERMPKKSGNCGNVTLTGGGEYNICLFSYYHSRFEKLCRACVFMYVVICIDSK